MRVRFSPLIVFAALLAPPLSGASAIDEKRLELLFRPHRGENMTLSPDGKHLALTEHVGGEVVIIVQDIDTLAVKTRIIADEDRPILHSKEKQRAELRFLRWGADGRLLFAPTVEVIPAPAAPNTESLALLGTEGAPPPVAAFRPKILAPVMSVDADGRNPKQLVDAKDFQVIDSTSGRAEMRAPMLRGFLPGDRSNLLFEIAGFDGEPTALHKVDTRTGKVTEIASEALGGRVFYDWQGRFRLNEIQERGGAGSTMYYRGAGEKGWRKFQPPKGSPFAASFGFTPDNYFGERTIPLGFDFDPNVLIVASNVGRDTFGIYGLDLKTWQRTALAVEHPRNDLAALGAHLPSPDLVFDEHKQILAGVRAPGVRPLTVWIDPQLAELQRRLDAKFPQRSVHIVEWSDDRDRLILRVTGGTDPGRIYAYRRSADLAVELSRRAPWLPNAALHATRFFEFEGPDGAQLSGFLTLPTTPRLNPPPMMVWLATGLPPRAHPEFDPQAQVFADMGFIVCRLNNRGIIGLGAKQRDALRSDFNGVPAADAIAAVEWVAARHRIDRRRVALCGEGFGAHHAVRAAELHPEAFRCAIALQPIFNLSAWVEPPADSQGQPTFAQRIDRLFLEGRGTKLNTLGVSGMAAEPSVPVFVAMPAIGNPEQAAAVAQLRSRLSRRDVPCTIVEFNRDFVHGLPAARARVYRALEEFINLNLYNYDVKIGPTQVIK